jgi:hypothetical protein
MTPDVFGTPQNVFSPETINVFRELGIDPVGKSKEQINAEIDSVIAREQRRLVFDPTDPLDYIASGLGLTGLGAGIGAGIKTARASKKLVGLTEKLQKLKNLKSLVDVRTPTGIISTTIPTAIGVRAISGAGDTSPDQIQVAIDALKEPTGSVAKTPSLAGVGAAGDSAETQDKDRTDTDDIADQGEDDGASQETVKTTADVGVPRFVDPSRMLDFARNVSLGLLQEGQLGGGGLGAGLAIGTQLAVTERQKKDLLAEQQKREDKLLQEEFEMKKEIAAASGTPSLDVKDVSTQSAKLRDEIDAFNSSESARGLIDASIFILNEAVKSGEKLTGAGGFFNKLGDQLQALANQEEGFDTLSARTQIDKLSEIVRTGNAREILDDPRLSNYEREIIGDVFGELKTLEDPSVALAKFTRARDDLVRQNKNRKTLIGTLHQGLLYGGGLGQESYISNAPEIQRIVNIDLDLDSSAATLARLISGQAFGKNVISLEGPRPNTQ